MPSPLAVPLVRPLAVPVTGRVLSSPLPSISSIAFAGDSITQNIGKWDTGTGNFFYSCAGYGVYALSKLGQALTNKLQSNGTPHFGGSGATAATVRSNAIPAVITAAPSACVVHCGTNDIAAGDSAATIQGRLAGIASDLIAGGVIPILTTILPRLSGTGEDTRRTTRMAVNAWLRANAAGLGAKLCDWESSLDADLDGYGEAAWYYDAAAPGHPGILGASTLGNYLATWLASNFRLPSGVFSALFAGTNYVNNPLLSGDNSGLATGITTSVSGGSSIVAKSKVARDDGIAGAWQRIQFSGPSNGYAAIYIPVTMTGVVAGDAVETLAEIRISSGTPAVVSTSFMQYYSYSTASARSTLNGMGTATWGGGAWATTDVLPASFGTEIQRTPKLVIPANYTNQGGSIIIYLYGSGTVDIARPILRKV